MLQKTSKVIHALAHPTRMQILAFIDAHQPVSVNKIYSSLALEQSVTSQHLRLLRQTALVETRREGKFILYNVNQNKLAGAAKFAHSLASLLE
ncbi:MAG: helix-turn-helix transcriptional regulator [Lewinellaceae bacterium]|nr:helix-turn-helix transcriptional regulator [Lewinellaceae bacterium]